MGWQGRYILGLKNNGLLQSYLGNSTAESLINDGVVETFQGFIPLLIEGNNTRNSLLNTSLWDEPTFEITEDTIPIYNKMYFIFINGKYEGVFNLNNFENGVTYYEQTNNSRYPRQIIAQNTVSKDFYILSCSGKGKTKNMGLTLEECIAYLKHYGCSFAYLLDQGGSVSTAYKNIEQVLPTDNSNFVTKYTSGVGTTERKVPDFIYFRKNINSQKDVSLNDLYAKINLLENKINQMEVNNTINNSLNMAQGNPAKVINFTENGLISLAFGNFNKETLENELISSFVVNDEDITLYDVVNQRSFARFFKNGGLSVLFNNNLQKLADIFADLHEITNLNDVDDTSISFAQGSAQNAPFNDQSYRGNFVITLVNKTAQSKPLKAQLVLYVGANPTQFAYRCYTDNQWSVWKFIDFS